MAKVRKQSLTQQSWASGATAALTPTMMVRGKCEQIAVRISNATNGITFTVTITDTDNSGQLYTQASIAENATTVYTANSNKATQDANFNAFLSDGSLTFTITPSGDPGASGVTVDIDLYLMESGE